MRSASDVFGTLFSSRARTVSRGAAKGKQPGDCCCAASLQIWRRLEPDATTERYAPTPAQGPSEILFLPSARSLPISTIVSFASLIALLQLRHAIERDRGHNGRQRRCLGPESASLYARNCQLPNALALRDWFRAEVPPAAHGARPPTESHPIRHRHLASPKIRIRVPIAEQRSGSEEPHPRKTTE